MDRATKERTIDEIKSLVQGSNAVVLTDYRGMTVEDMFTLRRKCQETDVGYFYLMVWVGLYASLCLPKAKKPRRLATRALTSWAMKS